MIWKFVHNLVDHCKSCRIITIIADLRLKLLIIHCRSVIVEGFKLVFCIHFANQRYEVEVGISQFLWEFFALYFSATNKAVSTLVCKIEALLHSDSKVYSKPIHLGIFDTHHNSEFLQIKSNSGAKYSWRFFLHQW